ncbi:transposase [Arthrobacter sp. CAU 1506]|uniref:RNA-guided endonuclease InsQ/TnpB family protein n=1 Tax=Arthrobacter sp. CAU 1506 TaxID=2560052 RepID=UPI0010ABFACE|nr:RNA-guided endonuclease TnpB family protein [Arthrobacter sp. CAU 1506]TJY71402.1 transposase [Arthrobacter sp. CAU 1506]
MLKRYRYRVYPTPDQEQCLARVFGCVRVVFNDAVAARNRARETGDVYSGRAELSAALTAAKRTPERAWLTEVSSVALQQSLADAEAAYRNFFDSLKGRRKGRKVQAPRFKSRRNATQSARFTRNAGFGLRKVGRDQGMLRLPKVGEVKTALSRDLPAAPSSVTIIREADGRYYASFVVDVAAMPRRTPKHATAGIDLGLEHLAVIAYNDGTSEKVQNPRHLKKKLAKLATAQRELARRQKGSTNREKSRRKVAVLHRKVRETRLDHHHKLARRIVDENQVIGTETLGITGLARTRLAKSVYDAGWGMLIRLIEEKAAEAGRTLVKAERSFPSTRLCSACGTIGEAQPLHVRAWTCRCGALNDRDINAAVNLLRVAAGHAETQLNACGGKVSPTPAPAHPDETGTTLSTAA